MIIYEEILREFQKQKVKYVIVGAIAVNLLGGLRNTADMDILVEMSNDNLRKAVQILTKQGYTVKQPVNPLGISDEETRKDWVHNKHMKAFNFYKDLELKEVDIIIDTPVSYEQARKNSLRVRCGDLVLPVIAIDHLIKMKEKAGRDIDKIDIKALKKIRQFRRRKE